ncbi:hypothetical protein BTVI_117713 [Pitangus sulphuratus]|nr:hypothetical protein BTVI_117713 [Pitangus sulphuratus]
MERGIQYLRGLAMLSMVFDDMNNAVTHRARRSSVNMTHVEELCMEPPLSFPSSLAVMAWRDKAAPMVDEVAHQLQEYEDKLSSSFIFPVEKLLQEFQHFREECPTPTHMDQPLSYKQQALKGG